MNQAEINLQKMITIFDLLNNTEWVTYRELQKANVDMDMLISMMASKLIQRIHINGRYKITENGYAILEIIKPKQGE